MLNLNTQINRIKEIMGVPLNESYYSKDNRKEYLKWKRNNVTIRGVNEIGEENNAGAMLGRGLYTAALSNKTLARQYGKVYFVVNAIPKNPKIFNSLNEWEIWFYNTLIYKYSKEKGSEYPDKRDFNAKTTIEDEMAKMGYDGIVIKGREMVNFKPKDVLYFRDDDELHTYYNSSQHELNEDNSLTDVDTDEYTIDKDFILYRNGTRIYYPDSKNDLIKYLKRNYPELLDQLDLGEEHERRFTIEHLSKLNSFAARVRYCEENLKRISSGSSRIVYSIDDTKVVKLAKNAKGIDQNETEIRSGNDSHISYLMAHVFEADYDKYTWLEMEFAHKLTESKFKEITGVDFKLFGEFITNYYYDREPSKKPRWLTIKEYPDDINTMMWENEFVYDILNYIGSYDIVVGDLTKLSSYGIVKRNNDDNIVLIDFGLSHDVYDTHYTKH